MCSDQHQHRDEHQLFVDRAEPWTVHAATSQRYTRVHHDELAARVLDLMGDHPAWELPLELRDAVMFRNFRGALGGFAADFLRFVFQSFVLDHAISLVRAFAVKSTIGMTRA